MAWMIQDLISVCGGVGGGVILWGKSMWGEVDLSPLSSAKVRDPVIQITE
jgi:hypothetical protein